MRKLSLREGKKYAKDHKTIKWVAAAAAAKLLQSCPTLCDPIDGSPLGLPVPGILQARTLQWVAISSSKCMKSESEVAQSCPTLCDPKDYKSIEVCRPEYWSG